MKAAMHTKEEEEEKNCKRKNLYKSHLTRLFVRLEALCHKTHPNAIFGDIFQVEAIVLLSLALHEYHTVVVTQPPLHF